MNMYFLKDIFSLSHEIDCALVTSDLYVYKNFKVSFLPTNLPNQLHIYLLPCLTTIRSITITKTTTKVAEKESNDRSNANKQAGKE